MKKEIIVIFAILLINSCASKTGKLELKSSFSDKILTAKGFNNLELGTPFKVIKTKFSNYKFQEDAEFFGYTFSDSNSTFEMFLSVYNDTLQGITISDTNFVLFNGLKVGDGILKIKKLYPNIPLIYNQHDEAEQFQIHSNNNYILIDIKSDNDNLLGSYKNDSSDSTYEFNVNGKIISIGMFRK